MKTTQVTMAVAMAAAMVVQVQASTFYVDPVKGLDTNDGSLGSPVLTISKAMTKVTAGAGDEVVLLKGTYKQTAAVGIKAQTTVRGETGDPKDVIVDCQGKCRAFSMGETATNAAVCSVTVINGCSNTGGAISSMHAKQTTDWTWGHTVSNCVFANCATKGPETTTWNVGPFGGAIASYRGGLTVCDSVFSNCVAAAGGAVALHNWRNQANGNEWPLVLKGCHFYGNVATNGSMTGVCKSADVTYGGGAVCVVDDWFAAQTSDPGDTLQSLTHGVMMQKCTFVGNICSNGCGGAISGPVLQAEDCVFTDNACREPSTTTSCYGGAWACCRKKTFAYSADRTTNVFARCTFARNRASGWGGACGWVGQPAVAFEDCTFDGNSSVGDSPCLSGGGVSSGTDATERGIAFRTCTFCNHTNLMVTVPATGVRSAGNASVCCFPASAKTEFVGCTISNNYCNGTGIMVFGANATFDRCVVRDNVLGNDPSVELSTTGQGADGLRNYRIQGVLKTLSYNNCNNAVVRNSLFVSNRCERTCGGAIAFCDTMNKAHAIDNCTFVGNGAAMRDATVKTLVGSSDRWPCAVWLHLTNDSGIPVTHFNNNLFFGNYDLDNPEAVQDVYCNYSVKSGTTDGVISNCFF